MDIRVNLFITPQYFRTAEVRENIQNTSDQAINKLVEKSGIKIPHDLRIYTHRLCRKHHQFYQISQSMHVVGYASE